jgi:hypothetical protein
MAQRFTRYARHFLLARRESAALGRPALMWAIKPALAAGKR